MFNSPGGSTIPSSDEIFAARSNPSTECNPSYQSKKYLYQDLMQKLQWWVNNLEISDKNLILTAASKTIVRTDVSKKGWEGHYQRVSIGVQSTPQESSFHMNILD